MRRKGGDYNEKTFEQEDTHERGNFLGRPQAGNEGKSWEVMPQMKELKELTLLVKQRMDESKWQGCVHIHHLPFF